MCVFLSVNFRERLMPSGVVNAQATIPLHFPTEFCLQVHKWLPLGTDSHPPEGKGKLEKYLYHWLEKALQTVTGPQKDHPKASAFPPGSSGNANLAAVSAPVPRSSLVCDLINVPSKDNLLPGFTNTYIGSLGFKYVLIWSHFCLSGNYIYDGQWMLTARCKERQTLSGFKKHLDRASFTLPESVSSEDWDEGWWAHCGNFSRHLPSNKSVKTLSWKTRSNSLETHFQCG